MIGSGVAAGAKNRTRCKIPHPLPQFLQRRHVRQSGKALVPQPARTRTAPAFLWQRQCSGAGEGVHVAAQKRRQGRPAAAVGIWRSLIPAAWAHISMATCIVP